MIVARAPIKNIQSRKINSKIQWKILPAIAPELNALIVEDVFIFRSINTRKER